MRLFLPLLLWACAPPAEPPATEGTLELLTYNVHGLPDGLTNTERPTAERMARIAPLLDDFDVVGLQEDFDPTHHATLVGETSHHHQWWFDARVEPDRIYGSGLTLLSRLPAVDYEELHYTDCHGLLDGSSDCLASKGLQRATFVLGRALLDVYHTHHEAGRGPDDLAARASQVQQVLDALAENPQRAAIFLGDTNLHAEDPGDAALLQAYADAGLLDACEAAGCPEPWQIDRFFVRSGDDLQLQVKAWERRAEFVDEDGADLSDHPALRLSLRWHAEGE